MAKRLVQPFFLFYYKTVAKYRTEKKDSSRYKHASLVLNEVIAMQNIAIEVVDNIDSKNLGLKKVTGKNAKISIFTATEKEVPKL